MNKARIVLSDSYVLFREGMHFILSGEEDFDVIGETDDNVNLYDLISGNPPDIVFIGIGENRQQDLDVLYRIRNDFPSVSVVLVADNDIDADIIVGAISCGISGYISRNTGESDLLDTVMSIAQGEIPVIDTMLVPDIASAVLRNLDNETGLEGSYKTYMAELSPYETELLTSISSGAQAARIAVKIDSDLKSIRQDMESIRNKLVENYRNKTMIENIQRGDAPGRLPDRESSDSQYVTREEFIEFKQSLKAIITDILSSLNDL